MEVRHAFHCSNAAMKFSANHYMVLPCSTASSSRRSLQLACQACSHVPIMLCCVCSCAAEKEAHKIFDEAAITVRWASSNPAAAAAAAATRLPVNSYLMGYQS
jgi:hypothetical protein